MNRTELQTRLDKLNARWSAGELNYECYEAEFNYLTSLLRA